MEIVNEFENAVYDMLMKTAEKFADYNLDWGVVYGAAKRAIEDYRDDCELAEDMNW